MAKQTINVGSAPNDATGDPLRTAFTKSNDNFTELYAAGQELGQCRLVYVNSTTIRLDRYNGSKLFINGAFYTIPSAGVTLAYGGQTLDVVYNVYAYMAGATMTLELATTARATDATYGHQIKSGDTTRTLVGKARLDSFVGPFLNDTERCYVISWFNRRPISLGKNLPSNSTTSAGLWVNIGASAYVQFLTWGEDAVMLLGEASITAAAAATAYLSIAVDDTPTTMKQGYSYGVSDVESMTSAHVVNLAEGYHYVNLYGGAGGGISVTYYSNLTRVMALING